MGNELAWLACDLAVDEDVGADFIVIPHVARRELEVPVHRPGVGIPGNRTVCIEVVAWPIGGIEHRDRVAGAPNGLVGVGVIGSGYPHGGPAGLPGIGAALPG